ncbi:hypothetical protein VFPFJ_01522 [Purpureocillium lilacinum]|uniref:Uncharacterized protein n=1 Tax=Purpureocillium lilacinum TaxID=33203 RepID=A0A179HZU4_PURLI|nr:hypothetical protein VFPFJ_01522 [Purpureocillium lilacinum]OAQ87453.1 hypothetical protein VFPBJ_01493 [Purpureocillium lilacinum]OAQ95412.1 hypothetical protein VFPFJ_01522 [Purpureocillium lilacinum]
MEARHSCTSAMPASGCSAARRASQLEKHEISAPSADRTSLAEAITPYQVTGKNGVRIPIAKRPAVLSKPLNVPVTSAT